MMLRQPLLLMSALMTCSGLMADENLHWGYSDTDGPENWADLSPDYALCGTGVNQSPIDITDTFATELDPLELDYRTGSTTIDNNGHTLQVNVRSGNWLRFGNEEFQLLQLHFHSPSEHRINGEEFPLEAHFVHENDRGELAVVGILFRDGEWNTYLEKIGKTGLRAGGKSVAIDIDFRDLKVSARHDSYYRYNGSFTTPPCTEGIRWFMLKEIGTASPDQAANFVSLIGKDARGPQPLNARIVLER